MFSTNWNTFDSIPVLELPTWVNNDNLEPFFYSLCENSQAINNNYCVALRPRAWNHYTWNADAALNVNIQVKDTSDGIVHSIISKQTMEFASIFPSFVIEYVLLV